MHLILRRDIRRLITDAEKVQKDLDMMKQNNEDCTSELQRNNLRHIVETIKHLEFNMSTMLSDCVSLGRQYWKDHNLPLIHSLHRSNAIMNSVLNNLSRMRRGLGGAWITPSELHQVATDWGRFRHSIYQIQKSMPYSQGRRKNHAWDRRRSLEL